MHRSVCPVVASFFACALTFGGSANPAEGAERLLKAHLDWTTPSNSRCPAERAIVRAVEVRLLRSVFVESREADVLLRVEIQPHGSKWSAKLEMLDRNRASLGTRHLESMSSDCAALVDVLPVVIALLVDASRNNVRLDLPAPSYHTPERPAAVAPPGLDNQAPAAKSSVPARPFRSPATSASPQESAWRLGWAGMAEGTLGLLPGLAPGASLVTIVEPRQLGIAFEFWLGVLAPTSSDLPSGTGMRLSLQHAGARLCPNLWQGSLRWALCAGMGAGSLQAYGRGFEVNQSDSSLHVDARVTAQLDMPIARPWFARLEAGAVFPLVRHPFVGESALGVRNVLHRPAVIVPRIAIGIGVGF